jgi:hypothetical protein
MKRPTTLESKTASSIWQRGVKSARSLVGLLIRAIPLMMGATSPGWIKASFVFARLTTELSKRQGQKGLALYLKGCNVILLRYISGEPLDNSRLAGPAVATTHSGIPRIIPGNHRLRIKQGEHAVIRFWLGLFTLYRVLDYPGVVRYSSIVGKGREVSNHFLLEWRGFMPVFMGYLWKMGASRFQTRVVPPQRLDKTDITHSQFDRSEKLYPPEVTERTKHLYKKRYVRRLLGYVVKLTPIMTSGPNSKDGSTSVSNVVDDILSWLTRPLYLCHLITLVTITYSWNLVDHPAWFVARWMLKDLEEREIRSCLSEGRILETTESGSPQLPVKGELGRLSIVREPGKARVVAMVDCVTQWILYPLHRFIFDKVLRVIPQDGTFNQMKPVRALLRKMEDQSLYECFSYDLSAATDRLPVTLQEILLGFLATDEFAFHWRALLSNRFYKIPRWSKNGLPDYYPKHLKDLGLVRYAVGQPMGAYSSWAMLAITHHAIVQFAAKRAGQVGWFDLYAVLGDDVVIGHRGVAYEYTKVMEEIGVNIGFHKSIISKNRSLEFAKRFFYKGVEVTPLPLAAIAISWISVNGVGEALKTSHDRVGKFPSIYQIARSMGFGFKAASRAATSSVEKLPKRLKSIVLVLSRPGSLPWSKQDLLQWISMKSTVSNYSHREAWSGSIQDWILHLCELTTPRALRRKVWDAFKGYTLPQRWAEEVVGLHEWWDKEVKSPYRDPMYALITEYEAKVDQIRSSEKAISSESALELLDTFEAMEKLACRLPVKVELKRNIKDVVRGVADRFPKTVRRWNQFRRRVKVFKPRTQ